MQFDAAHFWISFVTLVGGGYLAANHPELQAAVIPSVTTVLGFWFGARSMKNGNGNGNGVK